jgi:hypothetical protein
MSMSILTPFFAAAEKNRASSHERSVGVGIFAAILVAVLCGVGIGAGTAVLKIRQHPWKMGAGSPPPTSSGQLAIDQLQFNFGKLDSSQDGKHEFVITNRGDHPLTLSPGSTSCRCTVSEIKDQELAPGQSTKVLVTWHSKGRTGPFQQSVTIVTSDPLRPEVTLTIKGEFTKSVYADPEELTFGQIAGTEPVTRETRIFSTLPNQKIRIQGHKLTDLSLERYFQVDYRPLKADELRKYEGVKSGVLVRVTVKPGLPLGRFQQRILLSTNLTATAEIDLPLFGEIGEISLVGAGWNSETGVLDIGVVDGRSATQRKLLVLARGPNAKEMRFKVARVEPDFLKVTLGKTTVVNAMLSETELLIEIPPASEILEKKAPTNYMGEGNGKLGEILLETIQPQVHSLRIRLRFAVVGGN